MINKEHLAIKAKHGDELAFEELLKSEADKLYKIAYLHMQNKEDALDVILEATCKGITLIKVVPILELNGTETSDWNLLLFI